MAVRALELHDQGATPPSWSPTSTDLAYQCLLQLPCVGLHSVEIARPEGKLGLTLPGFELGSMMPTPRQIRNFLETVCIEVGFQAEGAAEEGAVMVRLSRSTPILLAFMLASHKHDLGGVVEHTGLEPAQSLSWELDGRNGGVEQSTLNTAWKSRSLEAWGIRDGHVFPYRQRNEQEKTAHAKRVANAEANALGRSNRESNARAEAEAERKRAEAEAERILLPAEKELEAPSEKPLVSWASADLSSVFHDFTNRYDLDGSQTINSSEELKQLCINLVIKLDLPLDVYDCDQRVMMAGGFVDDNPPGPHEWTF
jgi:hypothetical protein